MTLADYRKQRGEPVLPDETHDAHEENHPTALRYAQIGLVLAVITAVEVALYYVDMNFTLLVALLVMLSVVKFGFVVLWFMHLKFDAGIFQILFAGGMALTLTIFIVVIATQHGSLT